MERLLNREADRRIKGGDTMYTDSYGNAEALLHNPMQYDVFYIDMCKTAVSETKRIVDALLEKGVVAPIVLCCSGIDYRTQNYPEHITFLDKPIKVAELTESLDHAKEAKAQTPNTIEIREEKETYYVTEPDILYASKKHNAILVTLIDGRTLFTRNTIWNLYSQWESHKMFLPLSNAVINGRYIESLSHFHVKMTDGKRFVLSRSMRPYVQAFLEQQSANHSTVK